MSKQEKNEQRAKPSAAADQKELPRLRQNPRLVYNDPDTFFHDLLMEQQEQS